LEVNIVKKTFIGRIKHSVGLQGNVLGWTTRRGFLIVEATLEIQDSTEDMYFIWPAQRNEALIWEVLQRSRQGPSRCILCK
jgi:hypothetical protein